MRLHYLQHVPFEGPASIAPWAQARGHTLSATRLYAGEPLPAMGDIDGLIILGGPMNIYEEAAYPWLRQEKRYIERAMAAEKTLVGICLGAQLLADVLGASVRRNREKEIGWFPIQLTAAASTSPLFNAVPPQLLAFHWHGDTFGIPPGAVHLASSEACQHQAFAYGQRILGLQFHLESTPESVHQLITNCGDELVAAPYIQKPEEMRAPAATFETINTVMHGILDRLVETGGQSL